MKFYHQLLAALALAWALAACSSNAIDVTNFDQQAWRSDTNGCSGQRITMVGNLIQQQNALLRHTQNDIEAYLGKPDEHELYEKSRKYFYYYLEPNEKCNTDSTQQTPTRLSIRFNAMGFANEILIIR